MLNSLIRSFILRGFRKGGVRITCPRSSMRPGARSQVPDPLSFINISTPKLNLKHIYQHWLLPGIQMLLFFFSRGFGLPVKTNPWAPINALKAQSSQALWSGVYVTGHPRVPQARGQVSRAFSSEEVSAQFPCDQIYKKKSGKLQGTLQGCFLSPRTHAWDAAFPC